MSFGIDGEVVGLDVTRPAGPSVALERLVQKELAALGDNPREIGRSRGRGRGIEPERRGRVIDEADLTVPEPREERAGTRQHEPVHRTLARPDHERPIREEAGEGRRSQGHRESVPPRYHGVRADLHQGVPVLRERGVTGPRLVVDQPEVERAVQPEVIGRRIHGPVARSTMTRPPAFTASLLTPRRLESDRITTFAGAPPAANRSKALTRATGSAIPVFGGSPWR